MELAARRTLLCFTSALGLWIASIGSAQAQLSTVKKGIVNILGSTEGSGVIISSDNSNYKIATAWHVIAPNHKNEEIWIKTSDGMKHMVDNSSLVKLPNIDLAILSFSSPNYYPIVPIRSNSISTGATVIVSGWPNKGSKKLQTSIGKLISISGVGIDQGYSVLYTNMTKPGMSGGPIFSKDGGLVGIHGRGEKNNEEFARSTKTGINQGIPAFYLEQYLNGEPINSLKDHATDCGDYLAEARQSLSIPNNANITLSLARKAVDHCEQRGHAYFLMAYSARTLGDRQKAIQYYELAHTNNALSSNSLSNLAATRMESGFLDGQAINIKRVLSELNMSLKLNPENVYAMINLSNAYLLLNQTDRARHILIRGLSRYPKDKHLRDSLDMLEEGHEDMF